MRPGSTSRTPNDSTTARSLPALSTTITSASGSLSRSERRQRARAAPDSNATMTTEVLSAKRSVRPAAREHGWDRLDQDRDVHPERPVLEVVEIEPDEVVEAEVRATRDLPQPGDAGQDVVPLAVPVLELLVVAQRQRARADQAHLAAQDVEKLRYLVKREPAQQRADRRNSRITAHLEQRPARLVLPLEVRLVLGGVGVHRPELEHVELALAEADAAIAVEDRPGRGQRHTGRDQQPERQACNEDSRADDEVEGALEHPLPAREHRRVHLEQRHALAGDVVGALDEELRRLRRDLDLDAPAVRLLDRLEQLALVELRVGEEQLGDPRSREHPRQPLPGSQHRQGEAGP